jgi:heptosyltransferase-3
LAAPLPAKLRRALVIKLGHIGDVLVTTPVITALHQAHPGIEVTALVNEGTEAMLENSPYISRVLALRRRHAGRLDEARFQLGLLKDLRAQDFDLALELSGGDRGAFLARASGARLRVGFAPKKPHLRARAFHLLADGRGTVNHVVETFLRQVRLLGIEPMDTRLKLFPGEAARAQAAGLLAKHGLTPGGYALIHPTSRWMFKTWTPAGNALVVEHLRGLGLKVLLSAAPAEHEMRLVRQILDLLPSREGVVDLAGQLDLPLLAALMEKACVFFGVDSAPMHMAAALGVPVAVLFGPSGEKMWGPWQVASEVITRDESCRPCGRDGCQGSKVSRCLTEIQPEQATQALDRLLARTA